MYSIGVFGSAVVEEDVLAGKARDIGRSLGKQECTVITGACSGLPYLAAAEAARCGREVWGFSPVRNLQEQQEFVPEDDLSIYSRLIYIPESFPLGTDVNVAKKYRNVISTSHCDAGIILSGRWGTLHEFCSLIDFGAVIGVLTAAGGIADHLPSLVSAIDKPGNGDVSFHAQPEMLVTMVIDALERRRRSTWKQHTEI
jgi:predicted Rossmann-fold nucleotide-binding protein